MLKLSPNEFSDKGLEPWQHFFKAASNPNWQKLDVFSGHRDWLGAWEFVSPRLHPLDAFLRHLTAYLRDFDERNAGNVIIGNERFFRVAFDFAQLVAHFGAIVSVVLLRVYKCYYISLLYIFDP